MGIDIYVQDLNHKRVERVDGPLSSSLVDIISSSPVGSLIEGIHLYADTMFNSYQLKFFLSELSAIDPKNEMEEQMIAALRGASESAIRQHGYLWFVGD